MVRKMRSILPFVVVLLALLMVSGAMAQSATRVREIQLTGTVSAMTANTITVSGRVINIAQAEIKGTISVGAFVKVHYAAAANGTLVAREVAPAVRLTLPRTNLSVGGMNDDNGVDNPATHDLNDDNGVDNPEIHDVNDDNGVDNAEIHDVNDDNSGSNSGHNDSNSGSGSDSSGHNEDGGHHGGGDN